MPLNQRGQVGEINELRSVTDADDNPARPASDERLEDVRQQGENSDSLTGFTHTTESTNAEALGSQPVPDGTGVLIAAPSGNSASVWIGNSDAQPIELSPGGSIVLEVADTSIVTVRADNAGDSVGVLFEG